MLLAWYAMIAGIALFVPLTVIKTPTYCPQGFSTKPMIGSPISEIRQRKHTTGPRVLYLSLNHAAPYIMNPLAAYGGAPMHCAIATLNLSFVLRMMGRKNANPYAIVVTQKNINANP